MTATRLARLMCLDVLLVAVFAALAGGDEAVPAQGRVPAPAVTGRVLSFDGRPIPGVTIWLGQRSDAPQPRAITGPDGTFGFDESQPFPLLATCPPGWIYQQVRVARVRPPYPPVELRLQPATRIAGRVFDKSGAPAADVRVRALLEGHGSGCIIYGAVPPCENDYEPRSGITDADGRFAFEALRPGWWEISVASPDDKDKPQIVRRRAAAGRGIEDVEFILAWRRVPVEGLVLDAAGEPVAGASVSLSRALPSPSTETDATGAFHFPAALSGKAHLTVEHRDLGWIEQDVEIEEHPGRLDVRMRPVTLVQGRILGPDGTPVKQVFLSSGDQYVEVAADGTFQLAVQPGEHEITGRSLEPSAFTRERYTAQGELVDLDLRLAALGTVQVRLTGLPPEEKGQIDLKDRPEGAQFYSEKDLYEIDNVPAGEWTLVANDANGRSFERRVEVTEGEVTTLDEIHFPPLPPVRGRVLDPAGRPSAETGVTFRQGEREIQVETDPAGGFVTWLREGPWRVRAERPGFGSALATVEVPGEGPMELPALRLVRPVRVSGQVLGASPGVVVPWVQADDEDGLSAGWSEVGADGRFRLENLWPGTWTLHTDIDGRPVRATLEIPPDATEVHFDLDAGLSEASAEETP